MIEIKNEALTEQHLIDARTSVNNMMMFALSYPSYEKVFTNFTDVAALANYVNDHWDNNNKFLEQLSTHELRGCLFYEQRRQRHFGYGPYEKDLEYWNALLHQIEKKILQGKPPYASSLKP